jgi:membrane protein implicated in regulation of membrane protease activity
MPTFFHSPYFWLAASLLCLIAEIVLPSFTFAVFAVSALVTGLCAFALNNPYWLCAIFSASALLCFCFLRPWYFSFIHKKTGGLKFGFQSLVGKTGIVTQVISPNSPGYVKVDADEWKAYSDKTIITGAHAKIIKLDGNTVWVTDEI